ncbi:unnamed protein product [Miscanthus lutarioriparius]|uniref:Ent-kaurene oxidase n=1 Tax=Miscanthus lutarioriparius TaxID=422564 RepID=A0A811S4Y1_9POAL|nr:unnamed protein product [Miscanthus lutarioriparius]
MRRHRKPPPSHGGQLKEKKPHQTFSKWSEEYGPIYTIRTGASSAVVVNSAEVATEAMVAKYSSISTRKLSKAISVLSRGKKMVAMSDEGEFHKMVKPPYYETPLNFRDVFQNELFGLSMTQASLNTSSVLINTFSMLGVLPVLFWYCQHVPDDLVNNLYILIFETVLQIQALSEDVSSVYVEEFGKAFSREEIFQTAVTDMMMCAIEVDWRDFFPYLSWIPNRSFEERVLTTEARRTTVMQALINQQKKRIARGETRISYLDFLLAENTLTDEQILMLVWEAVIEGADTTLVITEWAIYEIAKHPEKQEYLYQEIQKVCGNKTVTEDHLPELPYLNAVFHETLRRHSPVPLVPPRFVHENTNLAGYEVPAGTEMIINLYGCNMNKSDWADPEEWKPERFLDGRFEAADLYKTVAFGAGRRACAGSMQAVNISCTTIARFVQEFAWRLKEGDEDKADTIQLTTNRLYPLHVYLTPRGRK